MIKKLVFGSILFATQIAAPLSFYFSDSGAQKLSQQIAQSTDTQELHTLIKAELAEYDKKVQQHILDYGLVHAIEQEDFNKAKILIKFGANPNTRGFRHSRATGSSKSLLMERAQYGSAAQVKFLLSHGAHTKDRDSRGAHVWHYAVNNPQFNRASAIFRALADRAREDLGDINYPGAHGDTALHEAARSAKLFFVRELVRLGANINAQDDKGFTPLDTLFDRMRWGELEHGHKKDYVPILLYLYERGARADYYGNSPNGLPNGLPDFLRESDLLSEENIARIEEARRFLVPRDQACIRIGKKRGWRAAARRFFGGGDGGNYDSNDAQAGEAYLLLEDAQDGGCGEEV